MNWLVLMVLSAVAGISLVIQQVLNANLRTAISSAAWAGFVSYFVGVLCMVLLVLALREPIPALGAVARIPWWAWLGGAFGATYIALSIVLIPQIGAATFMAVMIAGQMMASVAFDHYGMLGLAERPIDLWRVGGVVLLIAGVALIQR